MCVLMLNKLSLLLSLLRPDVIRSWVGWPVCLFADKLLYFLCAFVAARAHHHIVGLSDHDRALQREHKYCTFTAIEKKEQNKKKSSLLQLNPFG